MKSLEVNDDVCLGWVKFSLNFILKMKKNVQIFNQSVMSFLKVTDF